MEYLYFIIGWLAIGCLVSYPLEYGARRKRHERLPPEVMLMTLACWPYCVGVFVYCAYKALRGKHYESTDKK